MGRILVELDLLSLLQGILWVPHRQGVINPGIWESRLAVNVHHLYRGLQTVITGVLSHERPEKLTE